MKQNYMCIFDNIMFNVKLRRKSEMRSTFNSSGSSVKGLKFLWALEILLVFCL